MRTISRLLLLIVLAALTGVTLVGWRLGPVAAGYKAKTLCSGLFVSQRPQDRVLSEELQVEGQPVLRLVSTEVDSTARMVHGSFLGLIRRTALYRDGLGCTLAHDRSPGELRAQAEGFKASIPPLPSAALWPAGRRVEPVKSLPSIDMKRLHQTVDAAFGESQEQNSRQTRAVIVVRDGRIILERYAEGITPQMPLIGWSMTKSAMNALAGLLHADGRLDPERPLPDSLWSLASPAHKRITMDNLLRMTPGLAWKEDYKSPFSDVVAISWGSGDRVRFIAERGVEAEPGSVWNYSSGTSFLLAGAIKALLGGGLHDYWRFPRERLFGAIGMTSAVIEPDESGILGGGAFMYASPRDWARLGLLYLQDGVWMGKRIFAEGWVKYSLEPVGAAGAGGYLAHLWRRVPEPYYDRSGQRPDLPDDTYHMVGHWAQFVSVIPSQRLVVVRIGLSMKPWSWDQERFLVNILAAFNESGGRGKG